MKIYTSENCGELIKRSGFEDERIASAVHTIVEDVKKNGDRALFACEEKFDKTILTAETVRVGEKEFEEAYRAIDPALLESIRRAKERILNYHMRGATEGDVRTDEKGRTTGYLLRPVERAGIYVPGGTAPLFSSVCMGILPAKAAGVEHIYMATPAKEGKIHPATLVAAKECGAEAVFKMGGAQAIAAFAYGTESVPKTDVIAGPGNIYVTLAKKEVYGAVGIDMLAGPSEILIIADGAADVEYVAADMLSQAEHDERARAIVLTDDSVFAGILAAEVARQCALLPRKKTAQTSLDTNGGIVLVKDMKEAAAIADKIAPEHLEIYTQDPDSLLPLVHNAGAVFLGGCTPEPVGDYFAGPDHILPTGGTARFFQVLNRDIFLRKMSVIRYSPEALKEDGADIVRLAESEGLHAHANAVRVRLK
ncbi:MAG: histidinol dehydrogenase [Firmicutes bacterium]|nr:histidinol dehydrogenase [Clostridia bacterium]MBS5023566.1 histidinol dehydrogenase [Bacillota bacterium]